MNHHMVDLPVVGLILVCFVVVVINVILYSISLFLTTFLSFIT